MKQSALLFCLLCACFACQGPGRRAGILIDTADSLSATMPDSALRLICSLDPDSLPTERLRARHALVHSMILDKCYIDLQDDSIIRPAVGYYAEHGSDRERMLAYYYWARVAENAEQFTVSSERFLMAEHYLGGDTLDRYGALIERCLGDAYAVDFDFEPTVRHYRRSLQRFHALGERVNELRMYEYLALTYEMMGAYDAFDSLVVDAWPMAAEMGDTGMLLSLANGKAGCDLFRGADPRKVLCSLYAGYDRYNDGRVWEDDAGILALIYLKLGKTDSARRYLTRLEANKSLMTLSKQAGLLYIQERMMELDGDTARLMGVKDSINRITDTLHRYQRANSMERIERRFRARMLEESNQVLRARGRVMAIWGLALAALLTTVIVRLVKRSRRIVGRKNAQIAACLLELEDHRAVEHNLLDRLDMQVSKERELRELIESRFRQIRELATTYYQHPKTLRLAERVRRLALSEQMQSDLENMIDLYHDGIVTRLRNTGELTEDDIRLAVLLIAGFTPQQISIVTDTAVNTVYVRKLRLRNKIVLLRTPDAVGLLTEIFTSPER